MESTGDLPEVLQQDHEAENKVSIACSITSDGKDASIAPLLTGQQDNAHQKEEEEAENKVNIACCMTNGGEDPSIAPLNGQEDKSQQIEEEEAESKINIACNMANQEDTSIAPLMTAQQDNPEQKEEKSPSCLVLQEDEEAQFYYKQMHLQEAAWKLFQDCEKKMETLHFIGDLRREGLQESFHHLHRYLVKEEETRLAKQKDSVDTSMKDLEGRVQSLLAFSSAITNILVPLEKRHVTVTTEHLKALKEYLDELSKFNVPLKSHLSPFQVHDYRGIRHIVKPAVKSLYFEPNSANPYLFVSPNFKQVRYTGLPQARYTYSFFQPGLFVLGMPGFQCGQHYWEVDVGHKSNWMLGIVKDTVPRKGSCDLNIHNGFWMMRKEDDNTYYGCDLSTLKLTASPMRIGVFVDVSSGHLAFYNADTTELMFEISGCSFPAKLFPIFSPGVPVKEEDLCPLSLC